MNNTEMMTGMSVMIVAIAILVLLFFVFRKVTLWYWKIDKIEEHLAAIRKSLDKKSNN